jgi:chromosomal replication initiation ATPase DnaA
MKTPCENLAGSTTAEDPRVTAARIELRAFVTDMTLLIDQKLESLAIRLAQNQKALQSTLICADKLTLIGESVARQFNITVDLLYSARRTEVVAIPRQTAMYLARRLTIATFGVVGSHFGGRDHGTVIHAVRATEDRLAAYPKFRASVKRLEENLRATFIELDAREPLRSMGLPTTSPRTRSSITNHQSSIINHQ